MSRSFRLSLADEFVARHTCGPLIWCVTFLLRGSPPTVGELWSRVAARWSQLHRLRWVLTPAPGVPCGGRRRWTELPAFAVEEHVVADPAGPVSEAWAAALLVRPLAPGRPLWQLRLLPCPDEGGYALLLRMHHALGDGQSAVTLMRLLLDGPGDAVPRPRRRPEGSDPRRVLESFLGTGLAIPLPAGCRVEPGFAWATVDAGAFRAARRALPDGVATTTETLLAAAAGALRSCFGDPAGWGTGRARGRVFAWVPVSLRTAGNADELGNLASAPRLPLPVHHGTPLARLVACRGLVDAFGRRALALPWRLARVVSLAGPGAMDAVLARAMRPSHVAVSCTSLPWGRTRWVFDGHPVIRVVASSVVPPVGCCHFVLSNYAGTSTVSVSTHRLPGDAGRLAAAFVREVVRLAESGVV
ncbi:wax ester/triacylglycerol synthase domain-containing protein [Streptomyces gamaensis]|uniref:diacylglycerol O-acyltransferase n=1 Tax=Streptomyces gamaensis TaxID=1763542 RepID=A0ABW0Z2Z0_9ACTN